MEKMNSKPGLDAGLDEGTAKKAKPFAKPASRLTLAAVALAALNTVNCGGDAFGSSENSDQDAAADGALADVNTADSGKDSPAIDGDSNSNDSAKPDAPEGSVLPESGTDGEPAETGPVCDKLVFSKGDMTTIDIKPGQVNQNVKMMAVNLSADCAPHIMQQLSAIRQTFGSSDSFITAMNLTDAQNNNIATDTSEDPATNKYTFENLSETAPANTTRSLWITADFSPNIVPGTAYKLVVKCPDDVVTDAPKLVCQGADSMGQIYGPVINVVNP